MKALLARAADALGAGAFLRWRRRASLPILMYHGVSERPLAPACWHVLDVARFTEQLEWVARRYRVLPLGEALERLRAGTLPPRSAALTFDDGYANNAEVAEPVLRRLGLPATIFLVTDLVGGTTPPWPDVLYLAFARARAREVDLGALGLGVRPLADDAARAAAYAAAVHALKARPAAAKDQLLAQIVTSLDPTDLRDPGPFALLGWDDARALAREGLIDFGGHTTRHEILRHQSDADVLREVKTSHERVAQETDKTPTCFAYPNGRRQDFDARAEAAVTAAGIPFALTTVNGLNDAAAEPRALRRLCIGSDLAPHRFRLLMAGR